MNDRIFIYVLIFVVIGVIVLSFLAKHFKRLVVPNVFLVTGAVKTGKTLLAVSQAIRLYKKNLRLFYLKKSVATLFGKGGDFTEPPMLYSNINLARVKYNLLTLDIIRRKVRIPPKSVVLIDEGSLVADSMLFNDKQINNDLMIFVKLFAHLTRGGTLLISTQAVSDLHFAFKRCVGQYIYIQERRKLPFITILNVREMLYADEKSMNVVSEDLALTTRRVIIWNGAYKKYDCYCYSTLADYLPLQVVYDYDINNYKDDLKSYYLVTMHDFGRKLNQELIEYKKIHDEENGDDIENENE